MSNYIHPSQLLPDLGETLLGTRMKECKTLLDIGGGSGIVGRDGWAARGVVEFHVLDAWCGYKNVPGVLYCGMAQDALVRFGARSFDIVQCCETIEHLEKDEGHKLLEDLKEIARHLVIMTCPRGFQQQDPHHELCEGEVWAVNPFQLHKCGWEPEEFEAHGFSMHYNAGNVPGCQLVPYWVRG